MKIKFLFIILTVSSVVVAQQTSPQAVCGSCSFSPSTRIQCISERQYFNCDDTKLTIYTCLKGFCTANDPEGHPCSDQITASRCSGCDRCNKFTQFGCTSLVNYRYCDSNGELIGLEQTCPSGTYCNILSQQFDKPCSPFSGQEVLCYNESVNDYCSDKLNGNHPDPNPVPGQCNTFIACVDGKGERQTCLHPNNFSPAFRMCVNPLVEPCRQ